MGKPWMARGASGFLNNGERSREKELGYGREFSEQGIDRERGEGSDSLCGGIWPKIYRSGI